MKVMTDSNDIVFGNTGNAKAFSISASAKAFKVLSSTIYKHKIRAVVRELVCNAVDAHVINNQTDPYIIQCPNVMDPRFIVRDFGPGLSHDDMVELYTTYFASTKAERNDQIGALGLGSKSPFSYTSTFSVVSYFGGMVRVYQCMLSGGEPAIVKTHEEPMNADDKTGIEVIVPVKPDDIDKFENMISYIMRPFKSGSYKITGSAKIKVQAFDELSKDSKAEYFKLNTIHDAKSAYAVYGNIVYPLADVPGINYSWLLSDDNSSVYFNFDLGELDIQPSREELSLDEDTINAVISKVNTINKTKMVADVEHIKGITNIREVARIVKSMSATKYNILDKEGIQFNGKDISSIVEGFDFDGLVDNLKYCRVYYTAYNGIKLKKVAKKPKYRYVKASEVTPNSMFAYTKKRAFIIIADDKKNVRTSIEGWLLDNAHNSPNRDDYVVVVNPECPTQMNSIAMIEKIMDEDEVVILKSSEMEDIRKNIPGYGIKKPRDVSARPKTPNALLYTVNDGKDYFTCNDLFMTAQEIKDYEGYVIGTNRDDICVLSSDWAQLSNITLHDIKKYLISKGIKSFIVVKPGIQSRIAKNENIECIFKMMYHDYRDLVVKTKASDFHVNVSDRYATTARKIPKLKDYLFGNESLLDNNSQKLCGLMSRVTSFGSNKYRLALKRLESSYDEKLLYRKKEYIMKKKKLTKLSYSLSYTLNNLSFVDSDTLKAITKDVERLI